MIKNRIVTELMGGCWHISDGSLLGRCRKCDNIGWQNKPIDPVSFNQWAMSQGWWLDFIKHQIATEMSMFNRTRMLSSDEVAYFIKWLLSDFDHFIDLIIKFKEDKTIENKKAIQS
jgi:hypothetical protein